MRLMRLPDFSRLFLSGLTLGLAASAAGQSIDRVYQQYCATCHGDDLQGGMGTSLVDDEWAYGGTDADIARVIREGLPLKGMPAFGEQLDDEQVRAMVIYIREQQEQARLEGVRERVKPTDGVVTTEAHKFKLEPVVEADDKTFWSLDFMPDGAIIATEQAGHLWLIREGKLTEIKGIPEVRYRGQGGLLEVALHPDYEKNGWIYLSYSDDRFRGVSFTAVVRGRIEDGRWTDQETIFQVPRKQMFATAHHFGSRFVFKDGYLFFGVGERGHGELAQDLSRPNGKIFRLWDDGRVPDDNPFVDREDAIPAIWSYGHRNPQGLDLNPATGELWESEHGPRGGDELNLIEPGKNYGWPVITYGMNYNGTPITDQTAKPGMEQPITHWTPSIAVCGIDFYEGDPFPRWKGNLFVGGLVSEELQRVVIDGHEVVEREIILKDQGRVRDVASGPDGYLYVILNHKSPAVGSIYRLVPAE
ncbi:MAG: glucose sorbosone dehydrogenase [Puniceicoccaceae bacterium 5H]|nr:MAG: glucose sorbosone dehydrogenase [Puniceicoccaceae bacterium 5H]